MRKLLRRIEVLKKVHPHFRRLQYLKFRLTGGQGGRMAQRYLRELNLSEFGSADELESASNRKLRKLISEAYNNVSYYRKLMDGNGISIGDVRTLEDLKLFPIITKQDVRDNFDALLNDRFRNKKLRLIETGGTTGTPLRLYFSKHEDAVRSAHWERWKRFAGVKQFDRFIYMGMDKNAKHQKDYSGTFTLGNSYLVASFGLNDELLWKCWPKMKEFRPVYLRGYASACYILADFLKRHRIRYPLKAVMTSSDMLFNYQKKVIKKVFECDVFDHYGQVEDVVTATECEFHDGHHVNMESCIVEVLDADGRKLKDGEVGRIVGTQLENYCMPLIRYNVGDMGCLVTEDCRCGRKHVKIKKLLGRQDDWIITPDGKRVGVQINQTMEPMYEEILETQFIQETKDKLTVHFVPTMLATDDLEVRFEKAIREQVGGLIEIEFRRVAQIPKTLGGKHRLIVSKVGRMKK
ncbi:MAG: phenylacetate--CoA ligase family protein [Desulfobacteria bacterium]